MIGLGLFPKHYGGHCKRSPITIYGGLARPLSSSGCAASHPVAMLPDSALSMKGKTSLYVPHSYVGCQACPRVLHLCYISPHIT